MRNDEIMRYIDYTQLSPLATWEDINKMCSEAVKFQTASVCVPPAYVKVIKDIYNQQVNIGTVVGFPLGYNATTVKADEAEEALNHGADEIDMVINISDVKSGLFSKVGDEIELIRSICDSHILKVIIETCYLTEVEKIAMCKVVTESGADYISASTGFGIGGVTLADVEFIKKYIGENVKIKVAGEMKDKKELESFLQAGCERIGTYI